MTKSGTLKSMQASVMADPYAFAAKGAFWLSGAVAIGTLGAAIYMLTPSFGGEAPAPSALVADASADRWTPIAPPAEEPVGEPVRVKNPFDASEVFEFPAGTPPADARAMMSEMLLERARERYAQIDRRS